ncbi:MAG TPA: hypothetical protein RMF84_21195, partial [Polyangiaceae bacterium LLY-WYZ-14_1]|nr:hypothetical protein [Polyangiaceae bacterium LLY-WYZ-14_1]
VADAQAARAPLQTNMGFALPVVHPPLPQVAIDEAQTEHPVLFRLDAIVLPFTAPLEVTDALDAAEDAEVKVLAESTETSWILDGDSIDLSPRDPRQWRGRKDGPFPLVVAAEGVLPSAFAGGAGMSTEGAGDAGGPARSTKEVRVLAMGGAFFVRDEALPQANPRTGERPVTSSTAFALNAIDWLAQDSDLIAIRAKNVEDPPIEVPSDVRAAQQAQREAEQEAAAAAQAGDQEGVEAAVEEATQAEDEAKEALESWEARKNLYQWGNMLGIPVAFAIFGVIRWQLRSRRRQNLKI